ncbi:ATP-binding cassette domain-containing protein [Idiomarina seosinensis]|uniref:ATP-binding cassette domain-containing protein n=1 Tax=Idiomarina seosinensis TaxID=281739 RepID=UPI003B830C5F
MMSQVLEVKNLTKTFRGRRDWPWSPKSVAVEPISFTLGAGETLAIMGETGSGKSTLAKLVAGVESASGGAIYLNGQKLYDNNTKQRCQNIRMIFQDSEKSLNSQRTIGQQLEEPLLFNTKMNPEQRYHSVVQVLRKVGLLSEHYEFYPHMLSTGQKQRVAIARAITLEPQIIVADEALVALDPSVRAQIINLMLDLQQEMGISYIFVTHSPQIVKHIADKILILYRGKMISFEQTELLLNKSQEPYVEQLLHEHLSTEHSNKKRQKR